MASVSSSSIPSSSADEENVQQQLGSSRSVGENEVEEELHRHAAVAAPLPSSSTLRTSSSLTAAADTAYVTVQNNEDDSPDGLFLWSPTTSSSRSAWNCRALGITLVVLIVALLANVIVLLVVPPSSSSPQLDPHAETCTETTTAASTTIPWKPLPPPDSVITRIAFGSCARAEMPQPYWDTLQHYYQPDLTLLLGDNVYGDCTTDQCTKLLRAYQYFSELPSFQGAKRSLSMLAVLDDHDYGMDDCDGENNPYKDIALAKYLDFFNITDDRRQRLDGVYQSYLFGQDNQQNPNNSTTLQVILLDTRFHRSPFLPSDEPNTPRKERYMEDTVNTSKRMLSDTQWTWLQDQLKVPAKVRLIVSSIQVLADGTGFECWRMLPHERTRLMRLLESTLDESATFLLSGDRHVGGIYLYPSSEEKNRTLLAEVTASSWTHTAPLGAFDDCSTAAECDEVDDRRVSEFVRVNNFGSVDIDWEARRVHLGIRRAESSPYSAYSHHHRKGPTDAGELLQQQTFEIP